MREPKETANPRRIPRTLAGTAVAPADSARSQALQLYEAGLRLMQERKYDKATVTFEKILTNGPGDLCERVRIYIAACAQQLEHVRNSFASLDEQYDYAISLLNTGDYDDARQHLEDILEKDRNCDFVYYGLAVLSSMTGRQENCLEHLNEAIRLNPRNRIQARGDSDFQDMVDDPRFTELLYPEIS